MTDERRGLPSASASARYHQCKGAFLAGRGMPRTTNEDAEMGIRGHHALAQWYRGDKEPLLALPEAEQVTAHRALSLVVELVESLPPSETCKTALIEKRLWLEDGLLVLGSGQADVVFMLDQGWLVVDFKLGRLPTTPAEANHQLRSLVALLRQTLGDDPNDIYAAIVAPWSSPQTTLVRYDYQESLNALRATQELFRGALEGGPRTAGDECGYCPALGNCATANADGVLTVAKAVPLGVSPEQRLGLMPGADLSDFLNCVPRIEAVIEAAKAEAKRRLDADPESVPGHRLKPGAWKETITKPEEVFRRFVAKGGTSESFLPTVSVAKGKLSDALRAITGLKGEALENALDQLLAGCVDRKQNQPSLERVRDGQAS